MYPRSEIMEDIDLNTILRGGGSLLSSSQKDIPEEKKAGVVDVRIISGFSIRVYPGGKVFIINGSEWVKIGDQTYFKKKPKKEIKEIAKSSIKKEESY